MNKCIKCGNFVPEDANVCPFCGADLKQSYTQSSYQSYNPSYQDLSSRNYDQGYQVPPYQGANQQTPYQQQYQIQQPPYQVPPQSYQQNPVNPNVNYPTSTTSTTSTTDNLPKILGFSSIGLGIIACPANILAICGIFFSFIGLAVGIFGFVKSQEQTDKIINGVGIGISFIMLGLSCMNSIFGVLMFLGSQ